MELPDGKTAEWYLNTSDDAVIVITILKSREVLLLKSYKHGSGEFTTEFCAGMVDEGELPEYAAKRELLEETGYVGELEKVGECFANPTGSIMKYHFFIARNCVRVAEQNLDDTEQIELFIVKDMKEAKKILCDKKTHTGSAMLAALTFIH